jgi:GNAT superfamily N-acetyltransferase
MQGPVQELQAGDGRSLSELLSIYQDAIEPSEQKTADEIAALVGDPRYQILVHRSRDSVDGFAMVFLPDASSFWLLEYMAVKRSKRSSGIGAILFNAAVASAGQRAPGQCGVLEVDRPGAIVAPGNEPDRRLSFYRKLGCVEVLGLRYILPLATAGTPPDMVLLVHGMSRGEDVSRETLRDWLATLYSQVYSCAADDPRIDRMLSSCEASYRLG